MQRLAGVLLEMQPLDTDPHGLTVRQIDDHLAFSDERRFVLADLITLREIGIKVVLAVEHRFQVDPRREPEAGAHRLFDARLIDDRQHARHGRIHERDLRIGLAAKDRRSAGKEFRL